MACWLLKMTVARERDERNGQALRREKDTHKSEDSQALELNSLPTSGQVMWPRISPHQSPDTFSSKLKLHRDDSLVVESVALR